MLSWRLINQFSDEIWRVVSSIDIRKHKTSYSYWHYDRDSKKKIWGSVNKIKKYINDKRKTKGIWREDPN